MKKKAPPIIYIQKH